MKSRLTFPLDRDEKRDETTYFALKMILYVNNFKRGMCANVWSYVS